MIANLVTHNIRANCLPLKIPRTNLICKMYYNTLLAALLGESPVASPNRNYNISRLILNFTFYCQFGARY